MLCDAQAIDSVIAEDLALLAQCELAPASVTSEEMFVSTFGERFFTCRRSDGMEVELVSGGRNKPVTLLNRLEYCSLAEQFRLHVSRRTMECRRLRWFYDAAL
jgi:hypothetical protein